MIRTWIIAISGYTQTEGTLHGMQRLWLNLMPLNNPQTCIIQPPWDHNWEHLAERISLTSDHRDTRILVFAYSWGVGNGLVKFAAALKSRAMFINRAVLSDGVYHSQKFDAWPGLGHLMRGIGVAMGRDIQIPDNVERVDWFRQKQTFPRGGNLVFTRHTEHTEPVELDYPHVAMDDAPEFHERCLAVAGVSA